MIRIWFNAEILILIGITTSDHNALHNFPLDISRTCWKTPTTPPFSMLGQLQPSLHSARIQLRSLLCYRGTRLICLSVISPIRLCKNVLTLQNQTRMLLTGISNQALTYDCHVLLRMEPLPHTLDYSGMWWRVRLLEHVRWWCHPRSARLSHLGPLWASWLRNGPLVWPGIPANIILFYIVWK